MKSKKRNIPCAQTNSVWPPPYGHWKYFFKCCPLKKRLSNSPCKVFSIYVPWPIFSKNWNGPTITVETLYVCLSDRWVYPISKLDHWPQGLCYPQNSCQTTFWTIIDDYETLSLHSVSPLIFVKYWSISVKYNMEYLLLI